MKLIIFILIVLIIAALLIRIILRSVNQHSPLLMQLHAATSEDAADRKGSQFYERTVQNCGYETVVSVSAGTGRGYRPAEREYPATITPVVAVIQDGVSVAC